MSIFSILGGVLNNPLTQAAGDMLTASSKRKAAREKATAKLAAAKAENQQELSPKTEEWDSIVARQMKGSLKDEYVTVIITLPFVGIMLGSVWFAFSGDDRLLEGVAIALTRIKELGIDMSFLMYMVVGAALGIKMFGRR